MPGLPEAKTYAQIVTKVSCPFTEMNRNLSPRISDIQMDAHTYSDELKAETFTKASAARHRAHKWCALAAAFTSNMVKLFRNTSEHGHP